MINSVQKKVLILALYAGELMMNSGAEIYRVEDTVVRICKACKIDYVECFATTTGIFLSLDSGETDSDMHTFIKRIRGTGIDLNRISLVNTFSRVFTTTDLSIDDGFEQLRKISACKGYSMLLRLLGAILVGAFFCPIYKGGLGDMAIAGTISGLAFLLSYGISRLHFADFIRIFICCAAATCLALIAAVLGASDSISPVIVAATTIFLPGVAITNSARDFLAGDMLSGLARLAEACIAAVAIAGGVAVGIRFWIQAGIGMLENERTVIMDTPWFLLFGFLATMGFCLLFNAPKKHFVLISSIGGVGMMILVWMTPIHGAVSACFFGACGVAVLAELASRAGKDATTLFIIPGIIPFVPGAPLYEMMRNLLVGEYTGAVAQGTQALLIAGSIAIALTLIATVARLILALHQKLRNAS